MNIIYQFRGGGPLDGTVEKSDCVEEFVARTNLMNPDSNPSMSVYVLDYETPAIEGTVEAVYHFLGTFRHGEVAERVRQWQKEQQDGR